MSTQCDSATRCKAQRHGPRSSSIGRLSTNVLEGTFNDLKTEKIQCFHLFRLNAVQKQTGFCNLFHSDVCVCSLVVTTLLVRERLVGGGSEYFVVLIPTFAGLGNYHPFFKNKVDSRFNMHENHFFAVFAILELFPPSTHHE